MTFSYVQLPVIWPQIFKNRVILEVFLINILLIIIFIASVKDVILIGKAYLVLINRISSRGHAVIGTNVFLNAVLIDILCFCVTQFS